MLDRPTQTFFIIALAFAALIGAVSGVVAQAIFLSQHTVFSSSTSEQVDQKIVELIEEERATIAVVERVTPAVVSIVVKKEQGQLSAQQHPFGLNPFFVQQPILSEEESHQLVEVSSGSGFFVS